MGGCKKIDAFRLHSLPDFQHILNFKLPKVVQQHTLGVVLDEMLMVFVVDFVIYLSLKEF